MPLFADSCKYKTLGNSHTQNQTWCPSGLKTHIKHLFLGITNTDSRPQRHLIQVTYRRCWQNGQGTIQRENILPYNPAVECLYSALTLKTWSSTEMHLCENMVPRITKQTNRRLSSSSISKTSKITLALYIHNIKYLFVSFIKESPWKIE